jgi:fatty-acyl-CoA synthase
MWPLPGVKLRIRDPETGLDLPAGQSGEVLVKGPSVMLGYYKMPEATAAALSPDGWLATGDIGLLEPSGQFRFIGRLKDIIRVGGENLAPAELEDLLLRHPSIAASQVVGLPDPRLGEVPVAFVALKPGESCTPKDLIDWTRERIAGFKVPQHLMLVPGFEDVMTGSGKPRKELLRARALTSFSPSSAI